MKLGISGFVVSAIVLLTPAPALANFGKVLAGYTISGNAIPCTTQSDGVRVCHGTDGGGGANDLRFKSFDGTGLEIWVMLPPAPSSGPDGPYPLIVQSHWWGSSALGPNQFYFGPTGDTWAKDGFAVLQLSARGWGDSCGTSASRMADPSACANGYFHFDDVRYEARDIQSAIGALVDERIADPDHIGVTGVSYGGVVSLELATLKDRVMNTNGSFSPWTSPDGTPIRIAAAAPVVPYTDADYALTPNGRTLDYEITGPTDDLDPIGVEKQSLAAQDMQVGQDDGYWPPSSSDSPMNVWYPTISDGEPYNSSSLQAAVMQFAEYHSPYYLLSGAFGTAQESPAPLLIANGFTDDVAPVDEALRYYNLERSLYPSDPLTLFDGDFGHPRAQNKTYDVTQLYDRVQSFFEYYLRGDGSQPASDVTAIVETCPSSAPSGPMYTASSWAGLHPGEVDYNSTSTQTVDSRAGSTSIAHAIDPVGGDGACATVPSADQGAGVASYRLPAAQGNGYTLLGSPTVIADLEVSGSYPELIARLWDVNPSSGTETLVARGIYRPDPSNPNGTQVFQLHPGAWHFGAGNVPKLELLGQDPDYARTSNGTFSIAVMQLQLRLPVEEQPGAAPGVGTPLPPYNP